ncbi:MAG: hypothetical protein ACFB6S_16525 [Geminicoccaceae bacterium]
MPLIMPLDDNGHVIPTAAFKYRGTQKLDVSNSSVRNVLPIDFDIRLVTIVATGPVYFEVGGDSVDAVANGSPFLMAGQYMDVPLTADKRHIAFLAADADCAAYVIGRI